MRQLTKKSLDELAKVMPVVSETAQRTYIGRYRYYDISGVFLGKIGHSDEIRVMDRFFFDQFGNEGEADILYGQSSSFRDAPEIAKEGIIRSIGIGVGVQNINFDPRYSESEAEYNRTTGIISINLNSDFVNQGNYHDLHLMFIHEQQHSLMPGDTSSEASEYEACKAMRNHPYFKYASPSLQNYVNETISLYQQY